MTKFATQPLYLQVRDALAQQIAHNTWTAGNAIPNETDLAREWGVSPGTMRKALDLLEGEGLVSRRQGRGTFVNDPAASKMAVRYSRICIRTGERIVGDIKIVEVAEGAATDVERTRLRLQEGDRVCRIDRTRSYEGKAYLNEHATLPYTLFPGLAGTERHSLGIVALARAYGVLLGEAVEHVSLGVASRSSAEALQVVEGAAVLVLDRLIMARDGRPAEWRTAQCSMADMWYEAETT